MLVLRPLKLVVASCRPPPRAPHPLRRLKSSTSRAALLSAPSASWLDVDTSSDLIATVRSRALSVRALRDCRQNSGAFECAAHSSAALALSHVSLNAPAAPCCCQSAMKHASKHADQDRIV